MDNVVARHHRLAEGTRKAVEAWGLKLLCKHPRWQSDSLTVIEVPAGIDSNLIVKNAYARWGPFLSVGRPVGWFKGGVCWLEDCLLGCTAAKPPAQTDTPKNDLSIAIHPSKKPNHPRYNLSIGVGLSQVNGKVFRIGHLGNMDELMMCSALAGAEMAMRDAGMKIKPGSGVGSGEGRVVAGGGCWGAQEAARRDRCS
jgi:aspartate aminotransferase-like enzyme